MRAILDHFAADAELGLVGFGQSNRLPTGDRDTEGFVEAPQLKLRAAGQDLTIAAIAPATTGAHAVTGTQSVLTISETNLESATDSEWTGGEVRLVCHEWGEAIYSSLRPGHGKVTGSRKGATLVGVQFELTNDLVLWGGHTRLHGSVVYFITTGTLPGLDPSRSYYVRDVVPEGFKVAATPNGPVINLAGGSGTHVVTGIECLQVEWLSDVQAPATFTVTIASPAVVTQTAHGMPAGSAVTLTTTGTLPTGLVAGTTYYVANPTANTYNLTATLGSALINTSGSQSGTHTATLNLLAFLSGYVHLHDRFKGYDNVQFVTPYMPIAPSDYPAGTPVVPGVTLPDDVTSYSDLALVLAHTWEEGVDGFGYAGSCTVAGTTVTLTSGGPIGFTNLLQDGFLRVGNSKGIVLSNTTTTVTVVAWIGGTPSTPNSYEVHLPHWRNNPHHYTAGDGFLYPGDNSQPRLSGLTYSRPRGVLSGSFVSTTLDVARCNFAINVLTYAQILTDAPGQLACSVVSGKLRIQRTDTSRNPVTGVIQFEDFMRVGYPTKLINFGGLTAAIDGNWRVAALQHTTASAGSYIDLDPYDSTIVVPGSISGTVGATAFVQHLVRKRTYQFGAMVPTAWRLSAAIGRRIVCVCLAAGSTGQLPSGFSNDSGFQGRLGWYDHMLVKEWSPSKPAGLAARLQRLVEFIAPRAVVTSFGESHTLQVIAIDGMQGEDEAGTETGREMAQRLYPTFANWLRRVIRDAGLDPYPTAAKIPFNWPQITHEPWETTFGDTEGAVNAALTRWTILDGFATSPDVNAAPKKAGDVAHFNGVGQAMIAQIATDALLPLIDWALLFAMGDDAVEIANGALNLIGDAPTVTSLEPPNDTPAARLCAEKLPEVRDVILQHHAWTFCTVRLAAVLIEEAAVSTWAFAYALPGDWIHTFKVIAADATDDLQLGSQQRLEQLTVFRSVIPSTRLLPATQPFAIETTREGYKVLRTNLENAVIVYASRARPFELWDPMARLAAKHRLASEIVGGTVKGTEGTKQSQAHLQHSEYLMAVAKAQNAEYQQDRPVEARCPWLP